MFIKMLPYIGREKYQERKGSRSTCCYTRPHVNPNYNYAVMCCLADSGQRTLTPLRFLHSHPSQLDIDLPESVSNQYSLVLLVINELTEQHPGRSTLLHCSSRWPALLQAYRYVRHSPSSRPA